MAGYDFKPNLPPGIFNGLVFFGVVVFGSGYIIFSKLHDFGALAATEMALSLAGIPHKKGGVQAAMDYIVSAHSSGARVAAE